jgi:hypothetical protein
MTSPLGLKPDLPVVDLTSEAFGLLWQKRQQVLRMFLPIIVVLAAVDWLSQYLYPPVIDDSEVVFQPAQLIFAMVSVLLSILMATACHRFTLLPKEQWEANALHGFRRDEWRYLGRWLVISIIVGLALGSIALVGILVAGVEAMAVVLVVAVMSALYLMARLSITLPALAIGQNSPLTDAWALSRGNGSRLVVVVLLIPLLMGSPFIVLYALQPQLGVLAYVASMGAYIATLVSLVMLSLAYQFLCDVKGVEVVQDVSSAQEQKADDDDKHFDA